MSGSKQAIILALTYSVTILGTMFFSGKLTEKTLYNTYVVKFEGVRLPVTDLNRSAEFYREVLNLDPRPARTGEPDADYVRFPGERFLFLQRTDSAAPGSAQSYALIKVRNGFKHLYRSLLSRSGVEAQPAGADFDLCNKPPGTVSRIISTPNGQRFAVRDPDGNCLVFFQPSRNSRSWR